MGHTKQRNKRRKGRGKKRRKPRCSHIFCTDVSLSMSFTTFIDKTTSEEKKLIEAVKEGALRMADYIQKVFPQDRIGIVVFNDKAQVLANPDSPFEAKLQKEILALHKKCAGWTNITDGLRKSLNLLDQEGKRRKKKVLLLSDGKPNREANKLLAEVSRARHSRVQVDTFALSQECDFDLLETISSSTNGKFIYLKEMRKITQALLASVQQR